MKDFALITIGILVLLLTTGCNEDNITTEEEIVTSQGQGISGSFKLDTTGNGIYDMPVVNQEIILWDSTQNEEICPRLTTYTDEEGNYSFDGISIFDSDCVMSIQAGYIFPLQPNLNLYDFIRGDFTPDGDDGEEIISILDSIWPVIGVDLEVGEYDDGNNFRGRLYLNQVSGYVLEDTNMDGVGDTPASVWVTFFNPSDNSFSKRISTDENGFYKRESLKPGTYQIYISNYSYNYNLINAEDMSPDPDGTSNGTDYIDLIIEETESDDDNNFTLREI